VLFTFDERKLRRMVSLKVGDDSRLCKASKEKETETERGKEREKKKRKKKQAASGGNS
jgi:hypothetical protein